MFTAYCVKDLVFIRIWLERVVILDDLYFFIKKEPANMTLRAAYFFG
jgi:hypothetical protein